MKRIFTVLGSSLLVLVAVLVLRTALVKSRQIQAEPVKDLAIDSRAATERLAGAIRFPTISHEDGKRVETAVFLGLHEYLAPEMPFGPRLVLANLWLFDPLAKRQFGAKPAGNARIRTTTAATIFQAGIKENVLPHRARAVVNFRILPGDTIAGVLEHVRETVGSGIRVTPTGASRSEASPESDTGAPGFALIQRTLAQTFPDAVVSPNLLAGGTDTKHYQRLSGNVYRFVPIQMKTEDLDRLHGTNERVGVENYAEAVRFLRAVAAERGGLELEQRVERRTGVAR